MKILNFLGISNETRPDQNACENIENFDLRINSGQLINRRGYTQYYPAVPSQATTPSPGFPFDRLASLSILNFDTFVSVLTGEKKLVTVACGKANLHAEVGSNQNIFCVFIRPWYNGTAWIDEWKWLNETFRTYCTGHDNINGLAAIDIHTDDVGGEISLFPSTDDYFQKFVVINPQSSLPPAGRKYFSLVYASRKIADNKTRLAVCTTFHNYAEDEAPPGPDYLWLMKNFFPIETMQAMFNVASSDIVFYKVMDSLRIQFGCKADRLGISVGFLKNVLQLDSTEATDKKNATAYNEIALNPYNIISDATGEDYHTFVVTPSGSGSLLGAGDYYLTWSIILDGFQEFVIIKDSKQTVTTANYLTINFLLRWATLNKRTTHIRLYSSQDALNSTERITPSYLLKEWEIAKSSYVDANLKIDADGYLTLKSGSELVFNAALWAARGEDLTTALGHSATTTYAASMDKAIIADRKCLAMNCYFTEVLKNKIFYSPMQEAVFCYDVLVQQLYYDRENFDGNDMVGFDVLTNQDIVSIKRNMLEIVDGGTGIVKYSKIGYGTAAKRSVINLGDGVAWQNPDDILFTTIGNVINLSENSIRETVRASFSTSSVATRDKMDNAYLLADPTTSREYIFTKRGWQKSNLYLKPTAFSSDIDGNVLFLNTNQIFKFSNTVYTDRNLLNEENNVDVIWQSIKINKSTMNEVKDDVVFYIHSIFLYGDLNDQTLVMKIYLDKSSAHHQQLICTGTGAYKRYSVRMPLRSSCHEFYVKITGSLNKKITVQSLGCIMDIQRIRV